MPVITTKTQMRHTRESARWTIGHIEPIPPPSEGMITEDNSPTPPGDILMHDEPDIQMVTE